jgi:predicted small metal-binding protein
MPKYYIDCREVGYLDCKFRTVADSVEQVVEKCADHGGPELYARMRPHIHKVEETSSSNL